MIRCGRIATEARKWPTQGDHSIMTEVDVLKSRIEDLEKRIADTHVEIWSISQSFAWRELCEDGTETYKPEVFISMLDDLGSALNGVPNGNN